MAPSRLHSSPEVLGFLPHDAMLARYVPLSCICLSVASRCSTETAKRIGSRKQRHKIAQGLYFSDAKYIGKIQTKSLPTEAPNAGGMG